MQKYKQAAISIAFLTIILSGGISTGVLSASDSDSDDKVYTQQEAVLTAFENDDYDSWKKIISKKGGACRVISKNDFEKFIAARQAVRSGDYEKAIELSRKIENELKNKLGEQYFT